MDIVDATNAWLDFWANNLVTSTGLPRETYLPAVVLATVVGILSF